MRLFLALLYEKSYVLILLELVFHRWCVSCHSQKTNRRPPSWRIIVLKASLSPGWPYHKIYPPFIHQCSQVWYPKFIKITGVWYPLICFKLFSVSTFDHALHDRRGGGNNQDKSTDGLKSGYHILIPRIPHGIEHK